MTMKHLVVLVATILTLAPTDILAESNLKLAPFVYVPPEGFVPDADTAVKIGEIIVIRIEGRDQLDEGKAQLDMERPLTATLVEGVWIVKGTMPPGLLGGTAEIHIRKADGAILFYSHGA